MVANVARPRLYVADFVADEDGTTNDCGLVSPYFNSPSGYFARGYDDFGDEQCSLLAWADQADALGIEIGACLLWYAGRTAPGNEYFVGNAPLGAGGFNVNCAPLNQVGHENIIGQGFMTALGDTIQNNLDRFAEFICYGGMCEQAGLNPESESYTQELLQRTQLIDELGVTAAFDARAALAPQQPSGESVANNQHYDLELARQALGKKAIEESFRARYPGMELWDDLTSGGISDYGSSFDLAIANPATAYGWADYRRINARAIVRVKFDFGTVDERIAAMVAVARRGCSPMFDRSGLTSQEVRRALVAFRNATQMASAPRTSRPARVRRAAR